MFPVESDKDDAAEFAALVGRAVAGATLEATASSAVVAKVDSWFGERWLAFSHKALGAVRVTSDDLVVPPFVPARVVSQHQLEYRAASWSAPERVVPPLHVSQASSKNAQRKIRTLGPHDAFFWWSGGSLDSGRGSLMAYLPTPMGHEPWYIEARADLEWRPGVAKGIAPNRFLQLASLAA